MKRYFAAALLAVTLAACGLLPISPEQQIRDGGNAITVSATLTSSLLRVDKINKAQAQSYVAVMKTTKEHFDVAFKTLEDCRKKTGSTEKTTPDPCKASVESDIALGVSIAGQLKVILEAK